MQHAPEKVLPSWLNRLNIKVSLALIKKQLKTHPDYPSLLSITDTLDYLGIENIAVEIEKDQLHEIATPFLAHVQTNGGEFVIVENRDTLEMVYPGFYKNWSGVVVAAEASVSWKHEENDTLLQKESSAANKQYGKLALLALLVTGAAVFVAGWLIPSLVAVAAAGVCVSWMVVSKELGIENKVTDQVCGGDTGCDKVIHTKGAKLLPGIGWSDVGVTWFSSLLILLTLASFAGNHAGVIPFISILSACAVPFIFFSLFYQWRVSKKWCRLCLITVGLLLVQFILLLPSLLTVSANTIEFNNALFVSGILFLVSMAWFPVRSLLQQRKEFEKESHEGLRFKRNESVFLALLQNQRTIDTTSWKNDLQLGNASAPLQLTIACNPYCAPCAQVHEKMHHILQQFGDRVGLTMRFSVNTKNKEERITKAVEYIISHIEEVGSGMNTAEKASYSKDVLHQWFRLMDHEQFIKLYPGGGKVNVDGILKQHEDWAKQSKIAFTPTIFINGREMPAPYTVDDLPGLINLFTETIKATEQITEPEEILV